MDPLLIYILLLTTALGVLLLVRAFSQQPTRVCLLCEDRVPLSARSCSQCGYRF